MRRGPLLALALVLAAALAAAPADARKRKRHSRTQTVVKLRTPAAANATVAGFRLQLAHVKRKRQAKRALASLAAAQLAAGLPRNVSVYAVVAKQTRSDRVQGVLVAVNRRSMVATTARASRRRRRLTVTLRHGAVPRHYRLRLRLSQADNVVTRRRDLGCGHYFHRSDLAGARRLGGSGLPDITPAAVVQAACNLAHSREPFALLGPLRTALNAPSGTLPFTLSTQTPGELDGTATFNHPVRGFAVRADSGHQLTSCAFAAGTCTISSTAHPDDYALFTLPAPAAAGTQLPLALGVTPSVTSPPHFELIGIDSKRHREPALLTSGP